MKKVFIILLMVVGLFGSVSAHATVNPVFSVTTSSVSVGTTFDFYLSVAGTFYVNCGDGGELTSDAETNDVTGLVDGFYTIDRTNNTTRTLYTCTYTTAGNSKTISFASENITAYNSSDGDDTVAAISFSTTSAKALLTSISGNLSTLLPQLGTSGTSKLPSFRTTFYQCTHLTQIPTTLFNGYTRARSHMFRSTFNGCTGLTSIPEDLFASITTSASYMFYTTFYDCTGLTSIPEDLFASITTSATYMFRSTFYGCTGLISIPEDLFASITTSAIYMFRETFYGCTGLTSIPEDLFSFGGNNVSGKNYMFSYTFYGCTGLTSIPEDLFSHITSGATYLFGYTFTGCTGLTSIPEGLFSFGGNNVSGNPRMFQATFYNCKKLTSIPANLFSHVTSGAEHMFEYTFKGCTGLTSIPEGLFAFGGNNVSGQTSMFYQTFYNTRFTSIPANLFSHITSGANSMFYGTFYSCTKLTGYIPPSLFAGLVKNGSPTDTNMMYRTFYNTGSLAKTCPVGTAKYITGYESSWSTHVSCAPFVVTTTSLSANDTISFTISAAGTFEVNCGVGGTLTSSANDVSGNTITRNDTTVATYTCTYSTAGTKTIAFSGVATGYNSSNAAAISFSTASKTSVASVSGDLSAVFPTLTSAITGASTNPSFTSTFRQCTNLTSISENLFSHITTGASEMFAGTFDSCTGLTSIPSGLFANITNGEEAMFFETFSACTGLTSLPERLFANITTGDYMTFNGTFGYCTGLTGYIPPSMFSGLINESDPTQSVDADGSLSMMGDIFVNCTNLATSCDSYIGTSQYITGYESYWDGHVSCKPMAPFNVTYSCGSGSGTYPTSTTITYNSSFTPASNTCTVPAGYTFNKWLVSNTGTPGTMVSAGTTFKWTYKEDKTLTAQYTPNTLTLTFDGDETVSCDYGETFTLPPDPEPRRGYVFMGWKVNTQPSGE